VIIFSSVAARAILTLHAIRLSRNIYLYDWILLSFDNTKLASIASCVFLLADDNVKDEVNCTKTCSGFYQENALHTCI
jgi:hypothetical protein